MYTFSAENPDNVSVYYLNDLQQNAIEFPQTSQRYVDDVSSAEEISQQPEGSPESVEGTELLDQQRSSIINPEVDDIICAKLKIALANAILFAQLSLLIAHDIFQRDVHGWLDAQTLLPVLQNAGPDPNGGKMTPIRFARLWAAFEAIGERDNTYVGKAYSRRGARCEKAAERLQQTGLKSSDREPDYKFQELDQAALWEPYEALTQSVYRFITQIHRYTEFSVECFVIASIYMARLLNNDLHLALTHLSWRPILFSCLLLAHKYWDDDYLANHHFVAPYPPHHSSTANALERTTLKLLDYSVGIPPSIYAQAYFVLEASARIVRHGTVLEVGDSPSLPVENDDTDLFMYGDMHLFRHRLLNALYGTEEVSMATQQMLGRAAEVKIHLMKDLTGMVPAVGGSSTAMALPAIITANASAVCNDGSVRPLLGISPTASSPDVCGSGSNSSGVSTDKDMWRQYEHETNQRPDRHEPLFSRKGFFLGRDRDTSVEKLHHHKGPVNSRWGAIKRVFKKGPAGKGPVHQSSGDLTVASANARYSELISKDGWWGHSTLLLLTLLDVRGSSVIRQYFERQNRRVGGGSRNRLSSVEYARTGRPAGPAYPHSSRRRSVSFESLQSLKKQLQINDTNVPHIIGIQDPDDRPDINTSHVASRYTTLTGDENEFATDVT